MGRPPGSGGLPDALLPLARVLGCEPVEHTANVSVEHAPTVGPQAGRPSRPGMSRPYGSSRRIRPSSTQTRYVSTGMYAGSVRGLPVRTSNWAPCRGHVTMHSSRIEVPLGEWAIVVRTAILDRVQLPIRVEDADCEVALVDDPDCAGWELLGWDRRPELTRRSGDLELVESRPLLGKRGSLRAVERNLEDAETENRALDANGLSGIPISSRSSSVGIAATSPAVRPLTRSVSIEVAAWLMAQPRPSKRISSIVSPPSKLSVIDISSPQSGFWPSAFASAGSSTPWLRGFL